MLKKCLLFGMITVPTFLFAQSAVVIGSKTDQKLKNPQPIIGQVLYDFTYISDTTQPDQPQKEIVALDISNDYSKFYSQTFSKSQADMQAALEKQMKEQQGSGNLNFTLPPRQGTSDVFFSDKKTESISELKNFFAKSYLISDGKHTIDWDIQDATKKIGNYTCQKAVGTSRGRQYIVWFTTDLPYSFGPRRLNGLPGLILEAHDLTDRIAYTFKEYNTISGKEIGIPEQAIDATEKEFVDMQAAARSNASSFTQNSSPTPANSGAMGNDVSKIKSINVTIGGSGSGTKFSKKVINFPIDLTKDN